MKLAAILLALLWSAPALAIPICGSGKRVNCIVDGDSWWHAGVKYRHATINTPEIGHTAKCELEKRRGIVARDMLQELTAQGFQTIPTGRKGKFGRALATILLPDGREAGAVLIYQRVAKIYGSPDSKNWCRMGPVQF